MKKILTTKTYATLIHHPINASFAKKKSMLLWMTFVNYAQYYSTIRNFTGIAAGLLTFELFVFRKIYEKFPSRQKRKENLLLTLF